MEQGAAARRIFLDPDGTLPEWLFVVVEADTSILYEHQYGGTANLVGAVEGFLVPIDPTAVPTLRSTFSPTAEDWAERPSDVIGRLRYWPANGQQPSLLSLDTSRNSAEGWVPVITPDGPGILLWKNSD